MNPKEELRRNWHRHFNERGLDILLDDFFTLGWKRVVQFKVADAFHKVAQAMDINQLTRNRIEQLFFPTYQKPSEALGEPWHIRLGSSEVDYFLEKYGPSYEIRSI